MDKVRANKKLSIVAVASLVIVLIGSAVYFWAQEAPRQGQQNIASRQTSYQDPSTGVELKYPEQSTKTEAITEADKKEKILLRLAAQEGHSPMLITLRSESGLRVVANVTKATIIDILMGNSDKALPQRFKGFKKESSRRYEHGGRNAGEVIFTYDSPRPGERIKQRLVIVVKDDDMAVYLALQSKEADFQERNSKVFDPIVSSLSFE